MELPHYIHAEPANKYLWPVGVPKIENEKIILHDDIFLTQMREFNGTAYCLAMKEDELSERHIPVEVVQNCKCIMIEDHLCLHMPTYRNGKDYFLFPLETKEQIEMALGCILEFEDLKDEKVTDRTI